MASLSGLPSSSTANKKEKKPEAPGVAAARWNARRAAKDAYYEHRADEEGGDALAALIPRDRRRFREASERERAAFCVRCHEYGHPTYLCREKTRSSGSVSGRAAAGRTGLSSGGEGDALSEAVERLRRQRQAERGESVEPSVLQGTGTSGGGDAAVPQGENGETEQDVAEKRKKRRSKHSKKDRKRKKEDKRSRRRHRSHRKSHDGSEVDAQRARSRSGSRSRSDDGGKKRSRSRRSRRRKDSSSSDSLSWTSTSSSSG
jgi:hypothetical protein